MELKPHTLLKFGKADDLISDFPLPEWLFDALFGHMFAVIRRDVFLPGLIPVGIRGNSRGERFAAWLSPDCIKEVITPFMLTNEANWHITYPGYLPPPVWSLKKIIPIFNQTGLEWGPTGSTAFELATGRYCLRPTSDLDLVINTPEKMDTNAASRLLINLESFSKSRIDAQLETPKGAVALKEYASSSQVLIKGSTGPIIAQGSSLWD